LSVKLVRFNKRHLNRTFSWANNPELMLLMDYPKPVTKAEHLGWYKRIVKQHIFAIEADGLHVGNCCLKNIDGLSKHAELWIYIGDKGNRCRGYGRESLRQLLYYAFNKLSLNRVYLYVLSFNRKALKFYKNSGFKVEGRLREHRFINEKLHDVIYMGILKEEWGRDAKNSGC